MINHKPNSQLCCATKSMIVLLLFSAGCSTPIQPTIQLTALKLTSLTTTLSIENPRFTQAVTPTSNFTSSWTPKPPTMKPILTPIPVTPSPTLAPTLSQTQAEALVLDLLRTNAGCELPCWWGFTPGKTDWEIARDYFLSLGETIQQSHNSGNDAFSAGFRIEEHTFTIGASFYLENGKIKIISPYAETTPSWREIIYGDPYFLKAMERYLLPNILSKYGKPEQVLVYDLGTRDPVAPDYFLLLFYPKLGVLVEYFGQSKEHNDKLVLCPKDALIYMWLWAPEESLSLEEVFANEVNSSKNDRNRFLSNFRPVEAVSGISIDEFTTKFRSHQACLETPVKLWGRK
jgi:hypothetical protein